MANSKYGKSPVQLFVERQVAIENLKRLEANLLLSIRNIGQPKDSIVGVYNGKIVGEIKNIGE